MKSKVRTLFKCVNLTPLNQVVVSRVSQFSLSMALIYLVLGNVTINLNLEQGGAGVPGPCSALGLIPREHLRGGRSPPLTENSTSLEGILVVT